MAKQVGVPIDDRVRIAAMAAREKRRRLAGNRLLCYYDDPARFARECFNWPEGKSLAPYQDAAMTTVARDHRLAVRAPRGGGKTTTAALLLLWFCLTRNAAGIDFKVITTSGTFRQLKLFLWPEVALWARRLKWDVVGRAPFTPAELMNTMLKLEHGAATAVNSNVADLTEGAHASEILVILDESKSIKDSSFNSVEGSLSTGNAYALSISTPSVCSGRFYDIHRSAPGLGNWSKMHVTAAMAQAAGQQKADWAAEMRELWGETSQLYLNHVEGEFSDSAEDVCVPLAWVEAAQARHDDWLEAGGQLEALDQIGVDVAGRGKDLNALGLRYGRVLTEIRCYRESDLMQSTGRVAALLRANSQAVAVVDEQGLVGMGDRLREQGLPAVPFISSASAPTMADASGEVGFRNLRSAGWWNMRLILDPKSGLDVCLPPDPIEGAGRATLAGDLTAPHWRFNSSGLIQVESKDEIAKRLHRSTDLGDCCVYSFWPCDTEPEERELAVGTVICR